jgi:methylated-DNA-[protein]-cysteine S-methyltransferase
MVAQRIDRAGAARAVGGAVARSPIGIVVPCHRVIAGDGTLGGYGGDPYASRDDALDLKRDLLRLEGLDIRRRRD